MTAPPAPCDAVVVLGDTPPPQSARRRTSPPASHLFSGSRRCPPSGPLCLLCPTSNVVFMPPPPPRRAALPDLQCRILSKQSLRIVDVPRTVRGVGRAPSRGPRAPTGVATSTGSNPCCRSPGIQTATQRHFKVWAPPPPALRGSFPSASSDARPSPHPLRFPSPSHSRPPPPAPRDLCEGIWVPNVISLPPPATVQTTSLSTVATISG